ncbi:hypothetical protein GQ44DRAFT_743207 [Phaeosphaeriaceae sp. PMI808]|nr:hypothetical protein GQ44DRAFT_743207 [Phaeosphaeriaceae sp. PMI808]
MTGLDVSVSRKRHLPEQFTQPLGAPPPSPKRQRLAHPARLHPAPEFWDNLSKLWLTERALRELDRRNDQASSPIRFPYQRVTRSVLSQWKRKESNLRPTKRASDTFSSLTAGHMYDLKRFARHGGPNINDLRGYRLPQSRLHRTPRDSTYASSSNPTEETTSTKKSSPYDRDFQQHLTDYHIYPPRYRFPDGRRPPKPENWEEINAVLAQPRPSLSPSRFSDGAHERFVEGDADAVKEIQVRTNVIPIIEGTIADAKTASGQIPFTNLEPLTDDLPIAPNFLLAAKGPDGSAAVAGRQATYDGALCARAMHSLQTYKQDQPAYDNKAYAITSIYHAGQLKMFTSHPGVPSMQGGRPEYYTTQINGWSLTGNAKAFRGGATAYRNLRDWAKTQRDEAIQQANTRIAGASTVPAVRTVCTVCQSCLQSRSKQRRLKRLNSLSISW